MVLWAPPPAGNLPAFRGSEAARRQGRRGGAWYNPRVKFVRYAIVGAAAFGVDFGLLWLLAPHLPLLAANTIAFVVANLVNFALAHGWVFGRSLGEGSLARQYASVLGISVVGLALNDATVWIGVEALGTGLVVAKLAATAVALAWNYTARVRWVYAETGAP